jgi:hypothetical protein
MRLARFGYMSNRPSSRNHGPANRLYFTILLTIDDNSVRPFAVLHPLLGRPHWLSGAGGYTSTRFPGRSMRSNDAASSRGWWLTLTWQRLRCPTTRLVD